MRNEKLYNIIFPFWLMMFFPPIIIITLFGNYVIDSLVVIICFYVYKLKNDGVSLKSFYSKSIIKVWLYGFLSDFIGFLAMFGTLWGIDIISMDSTWINAVCMNPFSNIMAFIFVLIFIFISGFFIFFFNYRFVYSNIEDKSKRFKIALTIAIVTMPWTFLVPTELIYRH